MIPKHLQYSDIEAPTEFNSKGIGATCYIYTLHASNDPECRPRYVGFTRRLQRREIEHNTGREQGRKGIWVREVLAAGEHVILTPVHQFNSDNATERAMVEAEWIMYFRSKYCDLLNDLGGGEGVAPISNELRLKMSISGAGRVLTAEHRAKIAASKLGKKRDPWIIENLRKVNLGRKFSAERKASMSAVRLGKKASPETCLKISEANKGRKPSTESIAKRVQKLKGRKLTPEHRAKISAAGIGRKASLETIAKRSSLLRGKKRSPEAIERIRRAAILRFSNPEEREKCSKAQKLRFTDPNERAKNRRAQEIRFSNPQEAERNRITLTQASRKYWEDKRKA